MWEIPRGPPVPRAFLPALRAPTPGENTSAGPGHVGPSLQKVPFLDHQYNPPSITCQRKRTLQRHLLTSGNVDGRFVKSFPGVNYVLTLDFRRVPIAKLYRLFRSVMQLHVNAAPIICRDKHTSILKYGHIELYVHYSS